MDSVKLKLVTLAVIAGMLSQNSNGAEICTQTGGNDICIPPSLTPWRYSLCELGGPSAQIWRGWCMAQGGTVISPQQGYDYCSGAQPVTESNMLQFAHNFASLGGRTTFLKQDSGWGFKVDISDSCEAGKPYYRNYGSQPVLLGDVRRFKFGTNPTDQYGQSIDGSRNRQFVCCLLYTSPSPRD